MADTTKNLFLGNQGIARDSGLADMMDISQFASAGLTPDYVNFDGMDDYVNYNTIGFVLSLPTMFNVLGQDGIRINASIKNIIENHTVSVEGLNKRIEVEEYAVAYGGGGEQWQTDTNVTRAQSVVSTTHNDKKNRPIQRTTEFWIKCKAGDENSKTPLISLYDSTIRYTELVPSMYSAMILWVTPNETKTRVDKSWLHMHAWPKTAGDNTGQKDITTKGVAGPLNLEWFGTFQHGAGVDEMAQTMLDQLNRPALNTYLQRSAITEVHPDVQAATSGLLKMLDEQYKDMHTAANNITG